jgi:hypothetical protein
LSNRKWRCDLSSDVGKQVPRLRLLALGAPVMLARNDRVLRRDGFLV